LTSIEIPDSVTGIGMWAFSNCDSLAGVYITDIAAWCNILFSNIYSNPLYYAGNLYVNNQLVTDLVIPDSVTRIAHYAFSNCTGLTSVVIPDSVTTIDSYAFYSCTSLTSIVIPHSVTSIGYDAFFRCSKLKEIIFTGTTEQATTKVKVRNESWREDSAIEKIICSDGVIEL
jgi:hypothetical protein